MAPKYKPVRFKITENGCWEIYSHKPITNGYIILNRKGKMIRLHRKAYEIFNGPIPNGLFVCHTCDNKICINPDHLFIGSALDNIQDMDSKGRRINSYIPKKLTKEKVLTICQSVKSVKDLAKEYNVSRQTIYDVQQGKYWKIAGGKLRKGNGQGWKGDSEGHKKSAEIRWKGN